jgi:hypothetical protein
MKFLITKESNGQTMYALDYRPENLYRKFRWTTVSAQAREFEDGEVSTVDLFYFTKIPLKGKEPGRKYYWTSWTKTADGRIGEYFVSSMTTDKPLPYYKIHTSRGNRGDDQESEVMYSRSTGADSSTGGTSQEISWSN